MAWGWLHKLARFTVSEQTTVNIGNDTGHNGSETSCVISHSSYLCSSPCMTYQRHLGSISVSLHQLNKAKEQAKELLPVDRLIHVVHLRQGVTQMKHQTSNGQVTDSESVTINKLMRPIAPEVRLRELIAPWWLITIQLIRWPPSMFVNGPKKTPHMTDVYSVHLETTSSVMEIVLVILIFVLCCLPPPRRVCVGCCCLSTKIDPRLVLRSLLSLERTHSVLEVICSCVWIQVKLF